MIGNYLYNNLACGIGIWESGSDGGVTISGNTMFNNDHHIEFRAMSRPETATFGNISVMNNMFGAWGSIAWTTSSLIDTIRNTAVPGQANVTFSGNDYYGNTANRPYGTWLNTTANSLSELSSKLGVDANATNASHSFNAGSFSVRSTTYADVGQPSMWQVPSQAAEANCFDAAIKGHSLGDTVTLSVTGYKPFVQSGSGWTTQIYDMQGRYINLTVNNKQKQWIEANVRPYASVMQTRMDVTLTKITEYDLGAGLASERPKSNITGVSDGGLYNTDKIITFDNAAATLNGKPFNSGEIVKDEGNYSLVITDTDGNSEKVDFTIDKTAPKITIGSYGASPTNKDITVTATTNEGTLNATTHTFTANGSFDFVAMDNAGNVTTRTVTITNIDKTPPVISAIKTNKTGVANNGYANTNVTVTVSDSELASKSVTLNGKGISWPGNNTFSSEGKYSVTAKDKASLTTVFTFTIDKTSPKITVKNPSGKVIASKGSSKGGTALSYSEANYSSKSITLNGKRITWPSKNKVTAKGTYVITVTDKAANKSTFTFKVL
jgi:hypothetical protein